MDKTATCTWEFKSIRLQAAASVTLRNLEWTIKAQIKSPPQQKQEECSGGNGKPQTNLLMIQDWEKWLILQTLAQPQGGISPGWKNGLTDSRPAGWTRKRLEMPAKLCDCVTP